MGKVRRGRAVLFEEERLLLACQEAIAAAIERSGLTRSEVARKLGINRSFITRALSSGHGLTIRSLARISWAAGHRIDLAPLPPPKEGGTP